MSKKDTGWVKTKTKTETDHEWRRRVGGRLFRVRFIRWQGRSSLTSGCHYSLSEMKGEGEILGPYWVHIEDYQHKVVGKFNKLCFILFCGLFVVNRRIRSELKKGVAT